MPLSQGWRPRSAPEEEHRQHCLEWAALFSCTCGGWNRAVAGARSPKLDQASLGPCTGPRLLPRGLCHRRMPHTGGRLHTLPSCHTGTRPQSTSREGEDPVEGKVKQWKEGPPAHSHRRRKVTLPRDEGVTPPAAGRSLQPGPDTGSCTESQEWVLEKAVHQQQQDKQSRLTPRTPAASAGPGCEPRACLHHLSWMD